MSDLDEYRAAKDAYFRDGSASPLTAAQRAHFDGLRYYPEAPALVFELVSELLPPSAAVEMATSTGDTALYQRWARVTFEVDGAPVALTIFHDPMLGGLFLGFAEVLSVAYIGSTMRDAVAFGLLFLILLVRPQGLFGKVLERKA